MLLDQLMGAHRNATEDELEESQAKLLWDAHDVCQYSIQGECPYRIFHNTKSAMGRCPKQHCGPAVKFLKKDFDAAPLRERRPFQLEYRNFLDDIVSRLDHFVDAERERLALTQTNVLPAGKSEIRDQKLGELDKQIASLLGQMEKLGEDGKIDECQKLQNIVDKLQEERDLYADDSTETQLVRRQKGNTYELCSICGAMNEKDSPGHVNHFEGKRHHGWARIREVFDQVKKDLVDSTTKDADSTAPSSKTRENRDNRDRVDHDRRDTRDRDREHRRRGSNSRHRDSGRDRDSRRRSRSRDRDQRRRDRSRSRERHHSRRY